MKTEQRNRQIGIVKNMQRLADNAEYLQKKLDALEKLESAQLSSITLQYVTPVYEGFPTNKVKVDEKVENIIFCPNKENAEKIADYIKRVLESRIEALCKGIDELSNELKSAPSDVAASEQGK